MEERFSSQQELGQQRQSIIRRKPVGGHQMPLSQSPQEEQPQPSVEPPAPTQYLPYRTPVDEAPSTFQYIPYRSPVEDVPPPLRYTPYRGPAESISSISRNTTYRRPSAGRSSVSRDVSRYSTARLSRAHSTTHDMVSPVSPISSASYFRRPSTQSVEEVVSSISREVSQYQANDTAPPRVALSPLMELSAQEAAYRNSIQLSSPVGSLVRSRAATIGSVYRPTRQRLGPQSFGSVDTICDWLPLCLRWSYILFVFTLSIGLSAVILGLTIQSEKHEGLGQVRDSSIFTFAWRYTPTILAVLYTIFAAVIVKDVKRTEPFARLSGPDGASAASSLFLKPTPFWHDLMNALKKQKNGGYRNWALFWGAVMSLLGLLIVVPFSSALVSPRQVFGTRVTTFSALTASSGSPLELAADDSIIFRTTSSILLNSTTNAWVDNDYAVVPFWPSEHTLISGAVLSRSRQEWTARTTVYRSDLECDLMTLKGFGNYTVTKRLATTPSLTVYELINMTSFILESEDRCALGFAAYPAGLSTDSIFKSGGGWWSTSPNFSDPSLWNPGNGTVEGLDTNHPILLNTSSECGDRSMFIFATSYEEGDNFQARGQICKSSYFSAELPVTVTNNGSSSTFNFDTAQFNTSKSAVSSNDIDISAFEKAFMSSDWQSKFQAPISTSNPPTSRPKLGGPLTLLGARNNFDITKMMDNPNLVDEARQIKQRFFGESLLATLGTPGTPSLDLVKGQILVSEQKIVVSLSVGIILIVALLVSSLVTGLVMGYTRLNERPLNLSQDPATTKGMASLISAGQNTRAAFDGLDTSSENAMQRQLSKHVFHLRHGVIYSYDVRDAYQQSSPGSTQTYVEVNSKDWRPRILRGWVLALFTISLVAILVTLGILFHTFFNSGISSRPFSSNPSNNNDNSALVAVAPYSIIPTLIAVGIKLWWDPIENTFRTLQPYVSMAQWPTPPSKGTELSYFISPVLWVIGKATMNRHFFLASITLGGLLSQILIISMAALFNRNLGYRIQSQTIVNRDQLRTLPAIFTIPSPPANISDSTDGDASGVLRNVYDNSLNSWLYRATAETAFNSTPDPWTSGDWAFVPQDTRSWLNISGEETTTVFTSTEKKVTITTPSIRGKLQCKPLDMSNTSAWLSTLDFTDKDLWNDPTIPADIKTGYELKLGLSMNQSLPDGASKYWDDEHPYFTFFAGQNRMDCCGSGSVPSVGEAAVGYWSPAADSKHTSVVVKWITGHPFSDEFTDANNKSHWVWKDIPRVTALNCTPTFETANARVEVDLATDEVLDYIIIDDVVPDPHAWSNNYQALNVSTGLQYTENSNGSGLETGESQFVRNVSASYGYLFHDLLLGAANSAQLGNLSNNLDTAGDHNDRTFNIRQPGLNVDFMSYASLALVNNNNSALLDRTILANISSTVFSTFFKTFVQTPVPSMDGLYVKGRWGIQTRGDTLPPDLGPTLDSGSTVYLQDSASPSTTRQIIIATISSRVLKFEFNRIPVILSLSILGILAALTLFIAFYHKRYLRVLPRDVDTLGSVLGFIYSSERLLRSAADTYASDINSTAEDERVEMGWFNGGGRRRWGIEIVDEREKQGAGLPAVEEVDPARLEPLMSGGWRGNGNWEREQGGYGEGPLRVRNDNIDDFYGAYNTMANRTPPMAVASPPLGPLHVVRYG